MAKLNPHAVASYQSKKRRVARQGSEKTKGSAGSKIAENTKAQ
jgi:hypothetical protein